MIAAALLLAVIVLLVWPTRVLLMGARWTWLAPRAAVALWQAVAVATGTAIITMMFELASTTSAVPDHRRNVTDLTAKAIVSRPIGSSHGHFFSLVAGLIVATLVIGALLVHGIGLIRARAHQQALLDLVGEESTAIPDAVLLGHPRAAAYTVGGRRPRIVVSSGAVDALADDELAAVLAHERAHLRAHHDLVLLPFRCLTSALPRSRALAGVSNDVHALIEMAADDRAIRQCGSGALARAICRMATTDVPASSDGAAVGTPGSWPPVLPASMVTSRVERALRPRRNMRMAAVGSGVSALCVLALPFLALIASVGGR